MILLFFLGANSYIKNTKASNQDIPYIVYYFETNQYEYYTDEVLKINASWALNYSDSEGDAFVKVKLMDESDNISWCSREFHEVGIMKRNWSLNIDSLNLTQTIPMSRLKVRLLYYYYGDEMGIVEDQILDELEIEILKKNVTIEIIDYEKELIYGESQNITIKFLDSVNLTGLRNIPIKVGIISNNQAFTENVLITNSNGTINFMLSTYSELRTGSNTVNFNFEGNAIYSEVNISLPIHVNKLNVNLEIISQKCNITENDSFEMEFQLYYFLNDQKEFLNNKLIKVEIFRKQLLIYSHLIKIFENGKLFINISYSQIATVNGFIELRIELTLNETDKLKETISEFNIGVKINLDNENSNSEKFQESLDEKKLDNNEYFVNAVLFYFPFCFFLFSLIIGILHYKKNKNPKMLSEIYFKY